MSWDEPLTALQSMIHAFEAMAHGEAQDAVAEALATRGRELLLLTWSRQAAPDGSAWAAPARNYGHPLLDDTGAMRESATVEIGPRKDPQGFSLTFVVADEKASWHQWGTFRGGPTTHARRAQNRKSFRSGESERGHVPARPMLFFSADDAVEWINDLEETGGRALMSWLTAKIPF